MAIIEKKYRVRYRSRQGKGTKIVRVKVEEEDLLKCEGVLKKEQEVLIPLIKAQHFDLFNGAEIYSIGIV
ncbi:MAG: hypothetical protein WCR42_06085 [bacterium]